MKNKSKNLKGFSKALVFALIFALLYAEAAHILIPKINDASTGKPINVITSVGVLEDNTIDVIFLGNSNTYCGINPMKIWLDKGITSCIIATPFLTVSEMYYRAVDILRTQSPKYIILEVDCLFDESNDFDENGYVIYPEYEEEDSLGIAAVSNKLDDAEKSIQSIIDSKYPLMKYNYMWKRFTLKNLKEIKTEDAFTSRGYRPNKKTKPFLYGDTYMACTDNEKAPINDFELEYFYSLLDLCKQNDIQLALVSVPAGRFWNMHKHRSVVELAEQNGIDYVDFNLENELIPDFDWKKDTKDAGKHLNNSGASKITAAYENILSDKYGLSKSELTDEQRDVWNNDAVVFYQNTFNKTPNIKKNQS